MKLKNYEEFINEATNSIFQKTLNAFKKESENFKRVPQNELFVGLLGKILAKVGISTNPIPEEFKNATYEFLMDFIYCGIEPDDLEEGDLTSEEVLNSYMKIFDKIHFVAGDKNSPYQDKTIPYLKIR